MSGVVGIASLPTARSVYLSGSYAPIAVDHCKAAVDSFNRSRSSALHAFVFVGLICTVSHAYYSASGALLLKDLPTRAHSTCQIPFLNDSALVSPSETHTISFARKKTNIPNARVTSPNRMVEDYLLRPFPHSVYQSSLVRPWFANLMHRDA
ncbi:LANO_0B01596g1_1 [Lachancea nothofagi CBS 11611]|uniref:LANO_0B01596g1_1 n=1 Tax=Lachancea nothofagi CBS 11611 TaxID=1266666 RepID=A0A1G4IVC8_9SACH|nr:LANO_0B01596g1_1 [Lachancea nothofagi CBS 11611]